MNHLNPIEKRRILLLVVIMACVGLTMSGVSIAILYETSFEQTRQRLVQTVQSRARLIEAMTRHEIARLKDTPGEIVMSQVVEHVMMPVRDAHHRFSGLGRTAEFTMGRLEGDQIVFTLRHRAASSQDEPLRIPMRSYFAEPLRQALLGRSGVLVGPDYRGAIVLAAHEPVALLDMGMVAKIDLEEIRQPFIKAGAMVMGIGAGVIVLGTALFFKIGNPMVLKLMETEALRQSQRELGEAKTALQEKAVHLDNILRSSSDLAIVATDLAFRIRYFNPAAERMLQQRAEEMLEKTVQTIHQELGVDPQRFAHGIEQVVRGGEYPFEMRGTVGDAPYVLEARVSAILDRQGEVTGFVLMAHDVTDLRKAREALIRSERKYRLLIESANDAIFVADAQTGIVLDANPMAGELLGRPVAELIGMHQTGLHPPDEVLRYQQLFQEQVIQGRGLLSDIHVVRKDGRHIPVDIRAGVTDLGDQLVILGIFRDMTERKAHEARLVEMNLELEQRVAGRTLDLERSNRDLEQFAYVASHDLQEPLRLITGYVQLLEKRYRGQLDAQADKYIAYVTDGVIHMQSLINNLLGYARMGKNRLARIPTDLDEVFRRTLLHCEPVIRATGAVVTHDPLPTVSVDPVQMGQLLQNLLGNALKFRGEHAPVVHVSATREKGCWTIACQDNGIGIDSRHQERIFLIFQKLHPRTRYEGTGIGLTVCKRIVEGHGGRIWVESAPGQGSRFAFTIPAPQDESRG
ncbi:MAG: PAS domain S-box protein [Magnetococcales bacterium]|nr:PAS domain S-box protein [Magnetococcales bacterium]